MKKIKNLLKILNNQVQIKTIKMKINRKKPTYVFIIFIIERKIIFDLIIL